ncbi:hypothetical protein LSH36_3g16009 [Paralvinella palmiformis]|uniref:Uncharacterized protein n=1 Tax=Paralvinella palmiformis TaxID=53620 RepID=A0AAD9KFW1_9ANNE|nr:hypothetical protein LSH36_3g16009 [Paralvinella palmiformis]
MGKGEAVENSGPVYSGIQKDYLQGLDNLRKLVTNIELDVLRLRKKFCGSATGDDDRYEEYLKTCNDKLLYCNNQLRKNHVKLEVIDGEVKLVSMLNKVRELGDRCNPEVIAALSEFWERLKDAVESAQLIKRKYLDSCFKRLKSSCVSYLGHGDIRLKLTKDYADVVKTYQATITDILNKLDQLTKGYTLEVRQDLFTDTTFTNRILIACDQKAFSLLRLVPDLTEKLWTVCRISTQWIDKDETYVHDISNYIREKRLQTRKKKFDLRNEKEKRKRLSESVKGAHHLFKDNKEKLAKIENELQSLADTVNKYVDTKKYKLNEVRHKEGMVDFLDISISQTSKNYTLQLKRSRLMREVRELEDNLKEIEQELADMEKDMNKKADERLCLQQTLDKNSVSYRTFRNDLEKLNKIVGNLQKEVEELSDSLTQMEIIQSVKTSPEKVEDFYERPATVKLAPSLKEKIQIRRKKMTDTKHISK